MFLIVLMGFRDPVVAQTCKYCAFGVIMLLQAITMLLVFSCVISRIVLPKQESGCQWPESRSSQALNEGVQSNLINIARHEPLASDLLASQGRNCA